MTILVGLCFVAVPASAQETDATYAQRMELAQQMHEIWPVRPKVENALEQIAQNIPPGERASFKAAMRKAIKFKQLENESIAAMVETFSAEELQAMVTFYGSKEGRSVTAKIEDYQALLSPALTKMLDAALMQVKTGTAPGQ